MALWSYCEAGLIKRHQRDCAKIRKGEAHSEVKAFVQIVHHFRDEGLYDPVNLPIEHVAIFDEAQRAWTEI